MALRVDLDRRRRVHLLTEIPFAGDSEAAWQLLCEIETLATRDPFHCRFQIDGPLAPGAPVTIGHGLFGIRFFDRVGRILRVEEGRAVTFSDLSRRGAERGFPHIYRYSIIPAAKGEVSHAADERVRTLLRLEVLGRWTARWIPTPLVRLWLGWVLALATIRLFLHLRRAGARRGEVRFADTR